MSQTNKTSGAASSSSSDRIFGSSQDQEEWVKGSEIPDSVNTDCVDGTFNDILNFATQQERHDDDPQLDWRDLAREGSDGDSELGDVPSIETSQESSSSIPDLIFTPAANNNIDWTQPLSQYVVNEGYVCMLSQLCLATGTKAAYQAVLAGLPSAISAAKSLTLDDLFQPGSAELPIVEGLITFVWLTVCLKMFCNEQPNYKLLASSMGSLCLAAAHVWRSDDPRYWQTLVKWTKYWQHRTIETNWLNSDWYHSITFTGPHWISDDEISREYLDALGKDGIVSLATRILENDLKGSKRTPTREFYKQKPYRRPLTVEVMRILRAVKPEVLEALIKGSHSQDLECYGSAVANALDVLNDKEITQPSIYLNTLCDGKGISPTPTQWGQVCNSMMLYTQRSSNELAEKIDHTISPSTSWPRSLATRGLRRYADERSYLKERDPRPCESRRDKIRYFVEEMVKRVEEAGDQKDIPFARPVIEIGYSIDSLERLEEHRTHRNSNYIMNLAHATFEYLYPGMFGLQQNIIYGCYRAAQPWLAEIIFTQLAQGYTQGACGFSHYPAGCSNTSAYSTTSTEEWVKYFLRAERLYGLEKQAAEDERRMEAKYRRYKLREAQVKQLEALIEVLDACIELEGLDLEILNRSKADAGLPNMDER